MHKIYKVVLGIGVWLNAIAPASAATINFEIGFFDDSNTQVGSGTLSYDNDSPLTCSPIRGFVSCYTEEQLDNLSPSEEEDLIIYGTEIFNNPITNFDVDIYGVNWTNDLNRWWSDEASGQAPGYASNSRSSGRIVSDSSLFGELVSGDRTLNMDFDRSSDTSGAGTWSQFIQFLGDPPPDLPPDLPVEPGEPFSGTGGTWEANLIETNPSPSNPTPTPEPNNPTLVPEPSNVFSGLVVMFLGYSIRHTSRKVRQSKTK